MIREVVLWQVVFVHVLFSFWGCFFLGDSFRMRLPLNGEVAEWFKAHAWKACAPNRYRGFESLPLRHVPQPDTPSIFAPMPQEPLAAV